ncbi:MAG: hypothetical protein OEL84_04360 [Nitrosopumilus sp.]|nr:hypothetical protein [Nitrosopumilus sp.]MDH3340505.1 hypothetical protein [Nitrosopumilus sp.]
MYHVIFMIVILSVVIIGLTGESFGECPTCITEPRFEMNKNIFQTGEKLVITGVVPVLRENASITVQMFDNNNSQYVYEIIFLHSSNFQFEHTFCDNKKSSGTHTIKVEYFGRFASSNFNFVKDTSSENKYPLCEKISDDENSDNKPIGVFIPPWIKNSAGWWANGDIDDVTFLQGMEFLIKNGIVAVPTTPSHLPPALEIEIPSWVKNYAGWWANGDIDDTNFLKGIEFLVEQRVIVF